MERLRELITQLKEQFDRKADPAQMLDTTRLLDAELQHLASQPPPARVMPTKITVMMPSASKMYAGQQNGQTAANTPGQAAGDTRKDLANQHNSNTNGTSYPEPRKEGAPVEPRREPAVEPRKEPAVEARKDSTVEPRKDPVIEPRKDPAVEPRKEPTPIPVAASTPPEDARYMPSPVTPTPAPVPAVAVAHEAPATATLEKIVDRGTWPFNPLADKPTDRFTLSQKAREVNDVIGLNGSSSLNDKLKSEVSDLKSALNDTPVRDLRKAIGVNDRYVFINQLFRGDEVMYERSIKTINGFRILPEAEYWMERELKVKLGWDENREATRHFYQLVKRRFS
jgi:hypothetical protein